MDHFGAPRGAEKVSDVARLAAADAFGMQRVIGDQTAPDLDAALIADGDAIATRKRALDPRDPGGQQTLSVRERCGGARVDEYRAFQLQRAADPDLSRRNRIGGSEEPSA